MATSSSGAETMLVGGLCAAVGIVVLTGWAFEVATLKSIVPGWVTIKANTAIAFVLSGFALVLLGRPPTTLASTWSPRIRKYGPETLGALVGLIGLLTLVEYAFDWNPGFDQWLFRETEEAVATSTPGRMAPDTALCFLMLGAALGLAGRARKTGLNTSALAILGGLITTVAMAAMLAYLTPSLRTYGWGGLTPMSVATAAVFVALGATLLRHAWRSAVAVAPRADSLAGSAERAGRLFVLVFVLIATGLTSAGAYYYRRFEQQHRTEVDRQLTIVAGLKVSELAQWRKVRLEDGGLILNNAAFTALAGRFLEHPRDRDARAGLIDWLGKYPGRHDYDQARLLDPEGVSRLVVPGGSSTAAAAVVASIPKTLASRQVMFQDFYRSDADGRVYLGILVPIFSDRNGGRPLGVLLLRIDPEPSLYPYIMSWPTASTTAETLLVRREADKAVFLNELRFRTGSALVLRVPLEQTTQLAVKAALGLEGLFWEANDYRDVPVVGAVRRVPDSPWALVARMDVYEVHAPMRARLVEVALLISALLLAAGVGTGFAWRQQVLRFYRDKAKDSEANRETRDFLENLLNHASAPIIVWDPQFRITRFNQAFEKLSGRSAGDVIGTSLDILFPRESAAASMELIKETTGGERWEAVEVNILPRDGSVRTVLWNSATVFAADGKTPTATIAQGQDITERKRGEEEARSLNVQLEAANKELDAFSYSVSHDLRAPLRAIDGYGRMLTEDFKDRLNEDGQRILGVISSETRRMGQLVDDLLAFSRLGRQRLEFADVDMTELARAVADQEASRQPQRAIHIDVKPLPTAQGDRATLRVALVNLVSNAVKFTAPRNPALIEIGGVQVGDELVYHVKDNGVGFDMKYEAKLFGVFQRLHSAEEFEGTGVGLALVQRVISRHGGRVWGEGKSGSGATFYFSLPCRKEENP